MQCVRILQDLNIKSLYIGLESGDNQILKNAGKAYNRKDINLALNLAEKYRLPIHVPFMLGLPGTTYQILESDLELAKEVTSSFPNMKMIVSLPVLFPGTELFNNVRDHPEASSEYPGDLFRDDFFDYKKLFELNVKYFTSVDYATIIDTYEQMRRLITINGNFTTFSLNK